MATVVDPKVQRLDEQHRHNFNEQREQAVGEELAGESSRAQPALEYPEVIDKEGSTYEVLGVQESCPGCKQPPHLEGKQINTHTFTNFVKLEQRYLARCEGLRQLTDEVLPEM